MFRVQIRDASNTFLVKIEGRFSDRDAEYVQKLIASFRTSLDLVIDMTGVTFVDAAGEIALNSFKRLGAEFVANNSYSLDVCEQLHLPLSDKRRSSALGGSVPPFAAMEGVSSSSRAD